MTTSATISRYSQMAISHFGHTSLIVYHVLMRPNRSKPVLKCKRPIVYYACSGTKTELLAFITTIVWFKIRICRADIVANVKLFEFIFFINF